MWLGGTLRGFCVAVLSVDEQAGCGGTLEKLRVGGRSSSRGR